MSAPAAISITGPLEVIRELAASLGAAGVPVSEATELDSADVLNAPWNKAKVVAVAGVVTALLELGAGGVSLADQIADSMRSKSDQPIVIVIDNAVNPSGGQAVPSNATADQIQRAIDAALASQ